MPKYKIHLKEKEGDYEVCFCKTYTKDKALMRNDYAFLWRKEDSIPDMIEKINLILEKLE